MSAVICSYGDGIAVSVHLGGYIVAKLGDCDDRLLHHR